MKALMVIADGFEEVEAITTIDILRRCGIDVAVASITGKTELIGSHKIRIIADSLIEDVCTEYDALLLPGGLPNAHILRDDERVIKYVKDYNSKGKIIAAICAAPCVLEKAGIIEGKKVTSYPGSIDVNRVQYRQVKSVADGNIVTGNGVGGAIEFALLVAASLGNVKEAEKVRGQILYDWP